MEPVKDALPSKEYKCTGIGIAVAYAWVATGVVGWSWTDAVVIALLLTIPARWFAFFWGMGVLDAGHRRLTLEEFANAPGAAREKFDVLYSQLPDTAVTFTTPAILRVRRMLVEENVWWSSIAAFLAVMATWAYLDGDATVVELLVLVTCLPALALGLLALLGRNNASVRWIDQLLDARTAATEA